MSKGTQLRVAESDTKDCEDCVHCRPSMLFTLCMHSASRYSVAGNEDFHTIQHMRDLHVGLCGSDMKLRKEKV